MDPLLIELLDDVSDGVYFLDLNRRITYWSRGAERLTGYTADEVVGQCCAKNVLVHTDSDGRVLCGSHTCPAAKAMRGESPSEACIFVKHRDGHRLPVLTRVKPIYGKDGEVIGAAEVFTVTGEAVAIEARLRELEQMALLDPLTEVGNRRLGEKELGDRLGEAQRYGWPFGLLFFDVDRFKQVNDIHGHEVGDRLLQMVARTLSHNVRSSDSVIRWGGEEFLVLLKNMTDEHLLVTAHKLRGLVASCALSHGPLQLRVTVSVGATRAVCDDTPDTVVARADGLMYESKQGGGDRVSICSPQEVRRNRESLHPEP